MNVIQKALEMQNVDVAWSGNQPDNSSMITETYLNGTVGGFPRIVRTAADAGADIDIAQLRLDFDALLATTTKDNLIKAIKKKAGDIIYAEFSDEKQRNLTARGFELIRKEQVNGSLSPGELAEVAEIEAIWAWIKDVRTTSNAAEAAETPLHEINWPAFS